MILSCPECNGKVSSTALNCPHCGFAMRTDPVEDSVIDCPYCAEPIQRLATICPHCRGPVSQGKAVHPGHRPASRPSTPEKSFTSLAVICALLYLLCWPVGLVLNVMWMGEASTMESQTGHAPDGKGCLVATLVIGGILCVVIVLGVMRRM